MIRSFFIGKDVDLSEKIRDCYQGIRLEIGPQERVEHLFLAKDSWESGLPEKGKSLVFYEITETTPAPEKALIERIRSHNPDLQWVLLADSSIDYFEIALLYNIGNILKKGLFDTSVIRALTVRLMTGDLFGFSPYFPDGYLVGPVSRVIRGKVVISELMSYFENDYLKKAEVEERYRLRTYFYELLINAISYTVVGTTSQNRDLGENSVPSEVIIPSGKSFKISMAIDGEKSGFSVMDTSGTLSLSRILSKLRRQAAIGSEEHPPGIWDLTGRGLSLIMRDNRLIINIIRNTITEIIFLHYKKPEFNKYESVIVAEVMPG